MPLLWTRGRVLLDMPLRISNLPALSSRKCLGDDLQRDYLGLSGLRRGSSGLIRK